MAYNANAGRYQQDQYGSRPQVYAEQNGYAPHPHQHPNDQTYQEYQQEAFTTNQQYTQNYNPAWEQNQSQSELQNGVSDRAGAPRPQPRSYQYDDRFRNNGRQETQPPGGRRSPPPQSRPGTSASGRRTKRDQILAAGELDSPKAGGWDNPFGVFPGIKKDADQRRKAVEDSRSKSRAEIPSGRPAAAATLSRPATSAGSREPNTNMIPNQNWNEGRPATSHSNRLDSSGSNGQSANQYGQGGPMPIRQKRNSESRPHYNASGITPQTVGMDTRTFQQNLPVRSAPQGLISAQTIDRKPLSPPAPSAMHDSRSRTPYGRNQYPDQNPQQLSERNGNGFSDVPFDFATDQPDQNRSFDTNGNYQPHSESRADIQYESRGQLANQASEQPGSENRERGNSNGHFEYRGVKSSRSMTNLSDHPMPNFESMPADATESIERQVTLQSQQSYSAYQKPTYGEASSRPSPQDQTQNFRQGADPAQRYESDYPGPSQGNQGEYSQQQLPPRKGGRPEAQTRPTNGFRHPYNQPNQSRSPTQYQKSPPRGPPLPRQVHPPGQRVPRQEYGFDDQGHPAGNRFNPNPYYEDPSYEPYPREQAHSMDQPPALTRSQTEPVYQPDDYHYDQSYTRRGPPTRTQTFDTGYDQYPPNPPQGRRPKQYDQGPVHDQNRYQQPNRPRTANAPRAPMNQYQDPNMHRSRPPNPAFPIADRNHPVPIRPGLMSPPLAPAHAPVPVPAPVRMPIPMPMPISRPAPTPAPVNMTRAPVPAPQVATPHPQQNVAPPNPGSNVQSQKSPVTIKELSELRDALNRNPNDANLGLKFVKKSVEAANVLANDGGRADPKQVVKNRERYINDAYRVVKKLVANGSGDAMFYLADSYGTGQLGLEVNPKEAFQLYTSAAKINHPQAAYRVAVCSEMGMDGGGGTKRDHVKAVQFYKKAATLGDVPAMFKMGAILMKGLLGQQPNRREGVQWLKRAAERADVENPHALHELGSLHETAKPDDVVIKDERYALELFTRAANFGYKHSQARLGAAYEYGLMGCIIDPQTSIMWYSKAASQSEHLAEFALSGWYLTGAPPLLQANDQEAYLWARKAALAGLAKAEYAMGYYTETGIGTASNVEEAKKWYFRAAAQNDERARSRLEEFKRGAGKKERGRVSRSGVGRHNEGECAVM